MTAEIPVYSHEIYDILPDEKQVIQSPDFLILEGINVFQNQKNTRLYMTGYFDFSIYIDADINNIKKWSLERFDSLLELAKTDKNNYRSEEHTSELQSRFDLVCHLLLEENNNEKWR